MKQVQMVSQLTQQTQGKSLSNKSAQFIPSHPYGNIKVFYFKGKHLFSVGPDYCCSLSGFTFFVFFNLLMSWYSYSADINAIYKYFYIVLGITQLLSYLCVVLKDPGVVLRQKAEHQDALRDQEQKGIQRDRFCRRCGFRKIANSYHCRDCDVCIEGYHHHCPWVSKCIGKNNLKNFYVFVCLTPTYLVFSMITFVYIIAVSAIAAQQHLKDSKVHS